MVRNFEKFEVDHWYIYTGNYYVRVGCLSEDMKPINEHLPLQCSLSDKNYSANFYNGPTFDAIKGWNWTTDIDNWIEIEDPSLPLQKGDSVFKWEVAEISKNWVEDSAGEIAKNAEMYALKREYKNKSEGKDNAKFSIGTKVRVKKDLIVGKMYELVTYSDTMLPVGTITTISEITHCGFYKLDNCKWRFSYSKEMLEEVSEEMLYSKELIEKAIENEKHHTDLKFKSKINFELVQKIRSSSNTRKGVIKQKHILLSKTNGK